MNGGHSGDRRPPLLGGAPAIRLTGLIGLDVLVNLAALAAALGAGRLLWGDAVWRRTVALGVGFLTFVVLSLAILVAIQRFLLPVLPVGRFHKNSRQATSWLFYAAIASFPYRQVYRNYLTGFSLLGLLFYAAIGKRISTAITLGTDARLGDPAATSIGRGSILGEGASVYAHFVEGDDLIVDPVTIGDNVTVGARAFISPGVRIGDGAIVGAGAVVPKGTVVGSGEVWGGVPARRIA